MATIEERLTATGQDISSLTGGETTSSTPVNVGQYERWASAVGGGSTRHYPMAPRRIT